MNPNQEQQTPPVVEKTQPTAIERLTAVELVVASLENQVNSLTTSVDSLAAGPKPEVKEGWIDNEREHSLLLRAQRKLAEAEAQRVYEGVATNVKQVNAAIDADLKQARTAAWVGMAKIAMWLSSSVLMLTVAYHVS